MRSTGSSILTTRTTTTTPCSCGGHMDSILMSCWNRPHVFFLAMAGVWLTLVYAIRHVPQTQDIYESTPMCDPVSGICGEDSNHASPRTVYSSYSREQYLRWHDAHAALNISAAEFEQIIKRSNDQDESDNSSNVPLIFLGDSITESWLGTSMGIHSERAIGVPQVLQKRFGDKYNTLVLAIGGDQTQHLLYRMEHGELLPHVKDSTNAIFVVLIGTNNLGSGYLPDDTASGVEAVTEYLLAETHGHVLLLELLPRGDNSRFVQVCPPRCSDTVRGQPYISFPPAIDKVNEHIAAMGRTDHELQRLYPGRLIVADCTKAFLLDNGQVDPGLMPDLLHPNAAGHNLLATCILDHIAGHTR